MRSRRLLAIFLATALLPLLIGRAARASSAPFTIRWTAPGDDGLTGTATTYDLRYSTTPLTQANFLLAPRISGLPAPGPAGTAQSFVVSGLLDGTTYFLALRTADEVGNWSLISNVVQHVGITTGVVRIRLEFAFSSPWPNPARESVQWSYELPQPANVRVEIFDAMGRYVQTVADGERAAGDSQIAWDLRDARGFAAAAGIYFVRARLGPTEWTHRLLIAR